MAATSSTIVAVAALMVGTATTAIATVCGAPNTTAMPAATTITVTPTSIGTDTGMGITATATTITTAIRATATPQLPV